MKLVVQVATRLATRVVAPTVTAVGVVAAPIVIAAGLATVASALVLTFQRLAAGVPATTARDAEDLQRRGVAVRRARSCRRCRPV